MSQSTDRFGTKVIPVIHGLGSTSIQWVHQIEALEARFRLLVRTARREFLRPRERAAHLVGQFLPSIRLRQEGDSGVQPAVMHDCILRVAGGEEHF
jgi:hypothetical protein